jgi:hypothetical protein
VKCFFWEITWEISKYLKILKGNIAVKFPMGKYDGEKIKKLIMDGWSFREKTVSGNRYITRRKGQTERGMGRFSDDLWSLISNSLNEGDPPRSTEISGSVHENQVSDNEKIFLNSRAKTNHLLEEGILMDRAVYMMTNCVYRDEEGYCIFWNWDKQPVFFRYSDELSIGEYTRKMVYINGVENSRWVYFASPWYCKACPSFESDLTILNSALLATRMNRSARYSS